VTRNGSEHDRWAESVGAYLLDALPDDEHRGFEAHVAQCEACRGELATLRVAADALPLTAAPVEPPPELKARLMAEVQREASLLAAAGSSADEPAPPRRERRAWSWLRPAGALAAVAAAAVVAVLVLGGDDTSTFPARMDRAQVGPGAHGQLRVRHDAATLVVAGLRAPEDGRVYQLWIKRPGRRPEPTSALFVPRADGSATAGVPARLRDGEGVLVTSEPRGGSRAPTRAPLLSVSVS